MRIVLDTNAAISGLLWHGNPGQLLDAAHAGTVTLHTSAPLLAELYGVLTREKFTRQIAARGLDAARIFEGYAALAVVVVPAHIPPVILDDPDDDAVLACAVAAKADMVVSGDPHLLRLGRYEGMPIVSPAEAVQRLDLRL
ncbi:MAG: putative toxin-antitoxin system toxin component, PIN family [Vicinamibacterales bacterium]